MSGVDQGGLDPSPVCDVHDLIPVACESECHHLCGQIMIRGYIPSLKYFPVHDAGSKLFGYGTGGTATRLAVHPSQCPDNSLFRGNLQPLIMGTSKLPCC